MKKTAAFLIIFILIISLCSCGKIKNEESGYYTDDGGVTYPGITAESLTREYQSSAGKTVSAIDLTLPRLDEAAMPEGAGVINNYFDTIKKNALRKMELDTENAAEYLERTGTEGLRRTEINFEIKYLSDTLLSVITTERTAVDLDSVVPEPTAATFSLQTGARLSAQDFRLSDEDSDSDAHTALLDGIYKAGNQTYSPNKIPLSEDKKELFAETLDEKNFYVGDTSFTFVFPLYYISGGSRPGYYYCEVPQEYIADYYTEPVSYEPAEQ